MFLTDFVYQKCASPLSRRRPQIAVFRTFSIEIARFVLLFFVLFNGSKSLNGQNGAIETGKIEDQKSTGNLKISNANDIILEPKNWWAGMRHPTVSVMVRGEGIAFFEAKILKKRGVRLLKTERGDSPNYLFLELEIGPRATAGDVEIHLFDKKKDSKKVNWPIYEREKNSASRNGFGSSDAIYLIVPDRFANGDSTNDSHPFLKEKVDRTKPCGRHGGDLAGIRKNLDYIAEMGFSAIWATVLLENDQPTFSYHGYSITDFYQIDRRFGSNEEFKNLCSEARKKGIKTIMDMVPNHCGSGHWWISDPPFRDWTNVWSEGYVNSNHRKTLWQDPYGSVADRRKFVDGWFDRTMPDLNQRNPFLAKYLIQNAIWWCETVGLEGIRVDTWPYSDREFLEEWTRRLLLEYPKIGLVGEFWHDQPALIADWQSSSKKPNGLPSLFDFPLQMALVKSLTEPEGWEAGLDRLYVAQAMDFVWPAPEKLVVLASNHDMNRLFTTLVEDMGLFEMAMAYLLTTRGCPQFFYGDEILMRSPRERDDCVLRADMPGGWAGDAANVFDGKGLNDEQRSGQFFLKKLLNWRKSATAVHSGNLLHFAPEEGFLVHFRNDDRQRVMVILNKNSEPKKLSLSRFSEGLAESKKARNVVTGEVFDLGEAIDFSKKGALVLEVF